MQRAFVKSTTLRSAGYDAHSAVLELQFRHGAVYQYCLVPHSVYRDLLEAPSKGGYFNQNIRGRYSYQRVQDTSPLIPAGPLSI
jgi:hypothetical protein